MASPGEGAAPALRVRELRKTYDNGVQALKGVSLDVMPGDFFALLGPNGAGKSTLIGITSSLVNLSAGSVEVFGIDLASRRSEAMRQIGLVPQEINFNLFEQPLDILVNYAGFYGIPRAEALARAEAELRRAHLWEKARMMSRTLSGGMKRRLTLARALINAPELLVLDEPTTGLDPQARHTLWSRLEELKAQGTTLLLTTHYMDEAERLCDELVVMDHGRILDQGSPQALIARHVEPWVIEIRLAARRAADFASLAPLGKLEQHGSSLFLYTHDRQRALAQIDALAITLPALLQRPAGLEDVFLRLTGRDLREDA